MASVEVSSAIIVPFRSRPHTAARRHRPDQLSLLDGVYAAGSLVVEAADRETKALAARLQIAGFVVVEEVGADGAARRLRSSEAVAASAARPWRVSKPARGAAEVRLAGRAG